MLHSTSPLCPGVASYVAGFISFYSRWQTSYGGHPVGVVVLVLDWVEVVGVEEDTLARPARLVRHLLRQGRGAVVPVEQVSVGQVEQIVGAETSVSPYFLALFSI